ncbi:MAG: DUF2569 family protein [Nanoarchaeota archaeon]|nr:DUF2569 family protein [Nanoarchaeota archaeon]
MVKEKEINRIGGWLFLPTVMLIITLFYPLDVLGKYIGGEGVIPLQAIFAFFGGFFSVYSLILEFKKKKKFVNFAIISLLIWAFAEFVQALIFRGYTTFIPFLMIIIVIAYLIISERVKNTFVKK